MKKGMVSYGFKYSGGKKTGNNPYLTKMTNSVRIKVHRRVMEEHLGRKLSRQEHVHHINGNKQDNRIENLKILSHSQHAKLHHPKRNVSSILVVDPR